MCLVLFVLYVLFMLPLSSVAVDVLSNSIASGI